MYIDDIRKAVQEMKLHPDAPLAKAIDAIEGALDAQIRGLEASIERIETLEERVADLSSEVLPRTPDIP